MVKSIKVIDFEEFEEVHGEKFKGHAQMLSEDNIVFNMNHIHDVLLVVWPQILQDFELYTGLIVIFLLVLNDFDGDLSLIFVVYAPESSTKWSLAQKLHDFISVTNMISHDYLIVTLVVIISVIIVKTVFLLLISTTFTAVLNGIFTFFSNHCFFWLLFSVNFLGFIVS